MTAQEWIDAAQQRADAATDGPWEFDGESIGAGDSWVAHLAANFDHRPFAPADGDLIAAARTDLPKALDALRAVLDGADLWYSQEPGSWITTADAAQILRAAIAAALGTTP